MGFIMKKLYCITCPAGCQLTITGVAGDIEVEGNKCDKGYDFAETEMTNPMRTLTTTVRTKFPGVPVLSVRTAGEIPKGKLMEAMHALSEVIIETELGCGDTVMENVADTGVSVIVTSAALMQLGAELENKNTEIEKRGNITASGSAVASDGGFGIVRNPGVLDDIGTDSADGFVGAAGEAVGVAGSDDAESPEFEEVTDSGDGKMRIKQRSRPHIKR